MQGARCAAHCCQAVKIVALARTSVSKILRSSVSLPWLLDFLIVWGNKIMFYRYNANIRSCIVIRLLSKNKKTNCVTLPRISLGMLVHLCDAPFSHENVQPNL